MSNSPLNLFGSKRRRKRRKAKLAAMNPAERAAYQARKQSLMSSIGGGIGNVAAAGLTNFGGANNQGDVQSQISEINSKLDTLTGSGDTVGNNTIQTPGGDLTNPSVIDPMQAEETMMGGDEVDSQGNEISRIVGNKPITEIKNWYNG